MIRADHNRVRKGGGQICMLLLALALLLGAALPAQAENCSDFPDGVLDGFAGGIAPAQIQIDRTCTIRNFPASNPLSTNFSFLTQPGQTDERWLIIFDNVVHTGQMSCNSVAGHAIWFTNGSSTAIQEGCQNLLIAVEKIDKRNPAGQSTATVGVPFTYTLTMPVLFDPSTGTVINTSGSLNDLHGVTVWDDLNATGADLTYLSHVAYWEDTGDPVPHTFSNVGGLLTFDDFPIISAGRQIVLELTVVLDDSPANVLGTQFVNTAKWDFGRLIDGIYHEPLPGEWGVTDPMTIAAPEIAVTKTGPATLNRGELGDFRIELLNSGSFDAWNATILDRLPDGSSGGMCDATPTVLSAQVFAADGVTPVPGKGPLTAGTDYSFSYDGAPTCELSLTMLTAAGAIGPNERLIVTYQTRLDADTQNGTALTNVAGATQWFNGDASNLDRQGYIRTLTDGTVGTLDHEDAHTVTTALSGYFFEKSVANLTSGANPAVTAVPGDTLRYTLRLQTTDAGLSDLTFHDDLGSLNATPAFVSGSLALVAGSIPAGADTSNTDPNGGTNGAGILDIRNLSVPPDGEISVQFDIVLDPTLLDGTVVLNQAELIGGIKLADSDDPNINGQADPNVEGDEDPTQVVIRTVPIAPLLKQNTQATASIGESFSYRITVPETPYPFDIYDVRILDSLNASAADLRFLGVTKISGTQPWTPTNTGATTNLVIEDRSGGIDIPAGEQIELEIRVVLEDTPTNVSGLSFTNTASFVYRWTDGDADTELPGPAGTTEPMTIVGPDVLTLEKTGPAQMTVGAPGTFALEVHNAGTGRAWNLTITDQLPDTSTGGTCDVAPDQFTAQVFQADGVTAVSPPLALGTDFAANFSPAPACSLQIALLSPAATIGTDERLIVRYATRLDADTQDGALLTNIAGATEWFGADGSNPETADDRRTYTRELTDGTPDVLDHEDAFTTAVSLPQLVFEKTVMNVTSGADPATSAAPGDTLRYRLRVENSSDIALDDFAILDELDRLNDPAVFQPGTLSLVTVPAGADTSGTSDTGGARGTGVLDLRNLSLPNVGDALLIEFEIALAPVIANGRYATNQAQIAVDGVNFANSDDPNVNGPADPLVVGDEDPTRVLIQSAPAFRVEKVSSYVTGDPNVLLAGETLRYAIAVQNVGSDDAVDVTLVDQIPVNTQYVAGSTTLNGALVADAAGGIAPLSAGIAIYAPGDPTAGVMRADPSPTADNVATIVFDVVVDAGVLDGTVISNQAFVSAPAGGVSNQPSDDPRTPIADDPTRDVVGSTPLLFAPKSAALLVDAGSPGIVDPGDVLHYTISVYNSGAVPTTGATLSDGVPANTTYVADSLTLNGLPVGQPDGGVFPLASGIPISTSDLTPPLPGAGEGTLSPSESATIEFDLQVNAGVPGGTLITNQAVVRSAELADLLTDGDGNPATGPEPTVVVVGDGQQLSITKQVAVVGGGAALAGSQLEYTLNVVNIGAVPAYGVVITDDLDAPVPGQLAYLDPSVSMNGSTAGVTVAGALITANYSDVYGPLQSGESILLRFRAVIDSGLAIGTTIENTGVVRWNDPTETASATVSLDVGGIPGVGVLNGEVWHDSDFDRTTDGGERRLEGWIVDLYRNGQPLQSFVTDANGAFRIGGVAPNDLNGDQYELRFRAPDAGVNSAALGRSESAFTNGLQRIRDILVSAGSNLQGLDLPIDPNGVVYDSIRRAPVAGVTLTLLNASTGTALPSLCFDDPVQQGQVTRGDGYYKFDLNFSQAACPSGGGYLISIGASAPDFVDGGSQIIPPTSNASTAPFSVPTCPGSSADAILATSEYCEVQRSEFPPPPSVLARTAGTSYHAHLTLSNDQMPGSSQLFNNHIAVDPVLAGAVAITKTTPQQNVSRGQLVPYEITLRNTLGVMLTDLSIVDRFPVGFRYVEGSGRIEGVAAEPSVTDRELVFGVASIEPLSAITLRLLLAVGAGVTDGEYVNRAYAISNDSGGAVSGNASATVRLVPDPTVDCTDVMGKVFDDANRNGQQDAGEVGLPDVRLVTARGLIATTDPYGRFHITCAVVPNEDRGSNFVLKLDDRSLPSGFRMSTRKLQIKRATRGKALRFNFGASVHRVVGLDMADAVFEPDSTEIRPQWRPRIALLLEELQKAPGILRLSYIADVEDEGLVDERLDSVEKHITEAWEEIGDYELTIEPEIYWRRGAPPESR